MARLRENCAGAAATAAAAAAAAVGGCESQEAAAEQQSQWIREKQGEKQEKEEAHRRQREAAGHVTPPGVDGVQVVSGEHLKMKQQRQEQFLYPRYSTEERQEQQPKNQQENVRLEEERNSIQTRQVCSSFSPPVAADNSYSISSSVDPAAKTTHAVDTSICSNPSKWNGAAAAAAAATRPASTSIPATGATDSGPSSTGRGDNVSNSSSRRGQQQQQEEEEDVVTLEKQIQGLVTPLTPEFLQRHPGPLSSSQQQKGAAAGRTIPTVMISSWDRKTHQQSEEEQNAMLLVDILQQREVGDPEEVFDSDTSSSSAFSKREHKFRSSRFCTGRRRSSACRRKRSPFRNVSSAVVAQRFSAASSSVKKSQNVHLLCPDRGRAAPRHGRSSLAAANSERGGGGGGGGGGGEEEEEEEEEEETERRGRNSKRTPATAATPTELPSPESGTAAAATTTPTELPTAGRPSLVRQRMGRSPASLGGQWSSFNVFSRTADKQQLGTGTTSSCLEGRGDPTRQQNSMKVLVSSLGSCSSAAAKAAAIPANPLPSSSSNSTSSSNNNNNTLTSLPSPGSNILPFSGSPHSGSNSDSTTALATIIGSNNSTRLSSSTAPSSRRSGVEATTSRSSNNSDSGSSEAGAGRNSPSVKTTKKDKKKRRRSSSRSSQKHKRVAASVPTRAAIAAAAAGGGGGGGEGGGFDQETGFPAAPHNCRDELFGGDTEGDKREGEGEKREESREESRGGGGRRRGGVHGKERKTSFTTQKQKERHLGCSTDDLSISETIFIEEEDDDQEKGPASSSSSLSSCSSCSSSSPRLNKMKEKILLKIRSFISSFKDHVNIFNLISFISRVRHQVGNRFFLLLLSVFVLVRGVLYGLSHRALLPYLKGLKQDAGTYQSIDALGTVIWGMMGMVGALSDSVPLGGYQKRYYMLIANVLGVAGVCLLAFTPASVASANVWIVGLGTFLLCTQVSTLVLMCSGKYSELMEQQPEMKSDVVTFVFTCWMAGNLVGTSIVGPVSDAVGPQPLYYLAVPLAAQSLIPILLGFLPEKKLVFRIMSSRLWKNKRFFAMAAAVGVAATGVVIFTIWDTSNVRSTTAGGEAAASGSLLGVNPAAAAHAAAEAAAAASNRDEGDGSLLMVIYCLLASIGLIGLCWWSLPGPLARCNLYLFLWGLLNVSISGALDFFYTAKPSCLPDGPHFDYTYYATLISVVGTLASWAGIWVFHSFLSEWTFRQAFWLTIAIRCVASLFDYVMVLRFNVKVLKIPDKFMYLFGDAIIMHLVNTLNHMPGYILTSRLCPKGLESTAYAVMDGMSHIGWNFSKHVGVFATRLAGISTVETPENPCNFDNLATLTIVTQFALPLLAIPLSFFLLPNQVMSKRFEEQQQHELVEAEKKEGAEQKVKKRKKEGERTEKGKEEGDGSPSTLTREEGLPSSSKCITYVGSSTEEEMGCKEEHDRQEGAKGQKKEEEEEGEDRELEDFSFKKDVFASTESKEEDSKVEAMYRGGTAAEEKDKEGRRGQRQRRQWGDAQKSSFESLAASTIKRGAERRQQQCCEGVNRCSGGGEDAAACTGVTVLSEEEGEEGGLAAGRLSQRGQIEREETATSEEEEEKEEGMHREKEKRNGGWKPIMLWGRKRRSRRRGSTGKTKDRYISNERSNSRVFSNSNSERDDSSKILHPPGTNSSTVTTTTEGGERNEGRREQEASVFFEEKKTVQLQRRDSSERSTKKEKQHTNQALEEHVSATVSPPTPPPPSRSSRPEESLQTISVAGFHDRGNAGEARNRKEETTSGSESRKTGVITNILLKPHTRGEAGSAPPPSLATGDHEDKVAAATAGKRGIFWSGRNPVKWINRSNRRSAAQQYASAAAVPSVQTIAPSEKTFFSSLLPHRSQDNTAAESSQQEQHIQTCPATPAVAAAVCPPDTVVAALGSPTSPVSADGTLWKRITGIQEESGAAHKKETSANLKAVASRRGRGKEGGGGKRSVTTAVSETGAETAGACSSEDAKAVLEQGAAAGAAAAAPAAAREGQKAVGRGLKEVSLSQLSHRSSHSAAAAARRGTGTGPGKEEEAEGTAAVLAAADPLHGQQYASAGSLEEDVMNWKQEKKEEQEQQQEQQLQKKVFHALQQHQAEMLDDLLSKRIEEAHYHSGSETPFFFCRSRTQQQQEQQQQQQQSEQHSYYHQQQQNREQKEQRRKIPSLRFYWSEATAVLQNAEGKRGDTEGITAARRGDRTACPPTKTGNCGAMGVHGSRWKSVDVARQLFSQRASVFRSRTWSEETRTSLGGKRRLPKTAERFVLDHSKSPSDLARRRLLHAHSLDSGLSRIAGLSSYQAADIIEEEGRQSPLLGLSTYHATGLNEEEKQFPLASLSGFHAAGVNEEESRMSFEDEYTAQPLIKLAVAQPLDLAVAADTYCTPYNSSNLPAC